jgi:DNA topoisomerase-1
MIDKINDKIKKYRKTGKTKDKEKIKKLKKLKEMKKMLKNISLTTSKINYIDPRITIAFTKRMNITIDKFFNKTLLEKYKWTLDTNKNF